MKFRIQAHLEEIIEVDPDRYDGDVERAKAYAEECMWDQLRHTDGIVWSV